MYSEFILLILDYFRTLNKRILIYEVIIPNLIGLLVFFLLKKQETFLLCNDFRKSTLPLLGVLVGFSITIITILTTGHSRNLEEIRKKMTQFKIGSKQITLFQLLVINFTYSVVIEVFLIILDLIYPFISRSLDINDTIKIVGFSVYVSLIIHILLLTIRNMTDFYFIITKKENRA